MRKVLTAVLLTLASGATAQAPEEELMGKWLHANESIPSEIRLTFAPESYSLLVIVQGNRIHEEEGWWEVTDKLVLHAVEGDEEAKEEALEFGFGGDDEIWILREQKLQYARVAVFEEVGR